MSWFPPVCAFSSGFHQNSTHCSMATKTTMESKTVSLYKSRGNHKHILNCKKTTTKGGSTSIFKADCFALVYTILCILFWFPPKMALIAQWLRKQLCKVRSYLYKCVVENLIHILNCWKTTTIGCSTSIFKADCYVLVSTIFSVLCWFPQNSSHCSMATKTTMESKTMSLYKCCGKHIHILNCKKTTTKGGSTSIFKANCFALISTILCILFWFPLKWHSLLNGHENNLGK